MPYKSKEDQALAAHRYYQKNKKVMKQRAMIFKKKARLRNSQYLKEYLRSHPCIECDNKDIRVLEFDHVRGIKKGHVTTMANNGMSIKRLKTEIDKCEIRCSNCHRIRHHEERNNNQIVNF